MKTELFQIGKYYKRRVDIHDKYGGNVQNGISPSKEFPYIFIFNYSSGLSHGYNDQWISSDVFEYSGHGKVGDMVFYKNNGNVAVRDHKKNKKRIFLFSSVESGVVKYEGEMECLSYQYFPSLDSKLNQRIGIKFFLKRVESHLANFLEVGYLEANKNILDINDQEKDTETQNLIWTRLGQNLFRKRILYRWNCECAVTKFNVTSTLVASHILPWAKSDNIQRLDVENGLLLSPNFNSLFDLHLISFENSGKIILSDNISPDTFKTIKVFGSEKINGLSQGNKSYLEMHRNNLR